MTIDNDGLGIAFFVGNIIFSVALGTMFNPVIGWLFFGGAIMAQCFIVYVINMLVNFWKD